MKGKVRINVSLDAETLVKAGEIKKQEHRSSISNVVESLILREAERLSGIAKDHAPASKKEEVEA